jgi:hypothetical protein
MIPSLESKPRPARHFETARRDRLKYLCTFIHFYRQLDRTWMNAVLLLSFDISSAIIPHQPPIHLDLRHLTSAYDVVSGKLPPPVQK